MASICLQSTLVIIKSGQNVTGEREATSSTVQGLQTNA